MRLQFPIAQCAAKLSLALAIRQDQRIIEPLLQAIEEGTYGQDHDFAREALNELHDVERYPQLLKWKTNV